MRGSQGSISYSSFEKKKKQYKKLINHSMCRVGWYIFFSSTIYCQTYITIFNSIAIILFHSCMIAYEPITTGTYPSTLSDTHGHWQIHWHSVHWGEQSFRFAAATLWNSFPSDVRLSPSLPSFKNLKTFLFQRCFWTVFINLYCYLALHLLVSIVVVIFAKRPERY